MISRTKPAVVVAVVIFLASVALAFAIFSGDNTNNADYSVVGELPATEATAPKTEAEQQAAEQKAGSQSPIEKMFPGGGAATACSEAIGVDLVAGFGATLTINGRTLTDEEMNVNLDANGKISNVANPTRSIGYYTFTPDEKCPNGEFLRTRSNVLDICVYRLDDNTRKCTLRTDHRFDAL